MLRNAKELEHCELRARDGKIGHVHDFLFDDRQWVVRYLVIDTGPWLDRREVLISPTAVSRAEWDRRLLPVDLTREQVRQSPRVDIEQRLSPEQELALTQYYSWPMYWGGFPDVGFALPVVPIIPPRAEATPATEEARHARAVESSTVAAVHEDRHLRSVRTVTGHAIEATDGAIGHVADFLIDDRSWDIRYLLVDTRNWWPGRKVILAPQWIREVGWDDARVHVDLTRTAIKTSPAYDPAAPITPDYAGHLHRHYGRPPPPPPTAYF